VVTRGKEETMPEQVEFHFDFGSPNAYFAHQLIPGIEQRTGAKFQYVPILLGGVFKLTNNQPPMLQFKGIKNKGEYQRLEVRRFIKKHGLTRFQMNPHFPVNTVQIMRGAVASQAMGTFQRYVDVVFAAMWEEGKKMDDAEVIAATLAAGGLDAAETLRRIQEQGVKDQLIKNTEGSVARGTFGAPTFFVGNEIFFGKDSLGAVEEEIAAAR
jgi:2-hydroxychromene-2-carboxylate isomerase